MSGTAPTKESQSEPTTVTRYTYRYHNDSLTALNLLLLGLVLLIAVLGFFIFVQLGTEPKPLHFRLDKGMQIIKEVPLDQEGITTPALLNWVNEFVKIAFSFNYSNMNKQTSRLAPYFSDAAMKIYLDYLVTDEDFQSIINNSFVVAVVPKAAPEIVVGKAFQGRYAWQIEVPVTIIFSNALVKATQDAVLDFLIWRVPAEQSELGVNVATFTHRITGRTGVQALKQSNI